jgi:hypothetical protein
MKYKTQQCVCVLRALGCLLSFSSLIVRCFVSIFITLVLAAAVCKFLTDCSRPLVHHFPLWMHVHKQSSSSKGRHHEPDGFMRHVLHFAICLGLGSHCFLRMIHASVRDWVTIVSFIRSMLLSGTGFPSFPSYHASAVI